MSTVMNENVHPLSSGEFELVDPDRYDDVEHKQQRIAGFLRDNGFEAVLLQQPANFAWFTSGAEMPRLADEPAAALFLTSEARVIAANNLDAGHLFDRQLGGLGFQLKQRPWHEVRNVLLDDLCRGRNVASDSGFGSTTNVAPLIATLRQPLSAVECERLRKLGAFVAHAVEATCRHLEVGQTETEIAGQLAHRLFKHGVQPVELRVVADGRGATYRRWSYSDNPVRRWSFVSAVGRRWGLCCAATRTVVVGSPPGDLVTAFQHAGMLEATGMFFSQPGSTLANTWQKVRRIYDKTGVGDEWQHADQADVIGFAPSEVPLVPNSEFLLGLRQAIHWHPSVGPSQVGDTILIGAQGYELVTPPTEWPVLFVTVRGVPVHLPDMLVREAAGT